MTNVIAATGPVVRNGRRRRGALGRGTLALAALAALGVTGCRGCRGGGGNASPDGAPDFQQNSPENATIDDPITPPDDADAPSAAADAGPLLAPPRCALLVSGASGASLAPLASDVEVGEAIATQDGFAVGVLRKVHDQTMGSVALLTADPAHPATGAMTVAFVDLGQPLGDAPPPLPIVRGTELYATFFALPPQPADAADPGAHAKLSRQTPLALTGAERALRLFRIADQKAQLAQTLPQQQDESLAYDIAVGASGGAIVWDEDVVGVARGDIKIAILSPDLKQTVTTRVASTDASDAELPRIVARRGGYWIVWGASRPEDADAGSAPGEELERPAESRRFRWLEVAEVDERGAQVGAIKPLTPPSGHVSMFDLAPRPRELANNAAVDALDVLARDDVQDADGSGGRIVRITVKGDRIDPPIALVSDAVGRGVPVLLDIPLADGIAKIPPSPAASWLAFSDVHDHLRLVPLDATRTPIAPPSDETALEKARLLLGVKSVGPAVEFLAAFPTEPSAQIRRVTCAK